MSYGGYGCFWLHLLVISTFGGKPNVYYQPTNRQIVSFQIEALNLFYNLGMVLHLPAQVMVLSAHWADWPVSEGAIPAKTEVLRVISYDPADFGCLPAPPDVRK